MQQMRTYVRDVSTAMNCMLKDGYIAAYGKDDTFIIIKNESEDSEKLCWIKFEKRTVDSDKLDMFDVANWMLNHLKDNFGMDVIHPKKQCKCSARFLQGVKVTPNNIIEASSEKPLLTFTISIYEKDGM